MTDDVTRACRLLGPLEGRIMRAVWNGDLASEFVVRDALTLSPGLAYTTVMTTLGRLTTKGLLVASHRSGERAHRYRAAGTAADCLLLATRQRARDLVERFGDTALAAFAAELDSVPERDLDRLRRLRG